MGGQECVGEDKCFPALPIPGSDASPRCPLKVAIAHLGTIAYCQWAFTFGEAEVETPPPPEGETEESVRKRVLEGLQIDQEKA